MKQKQAFSHTLWMAGAPVPSSAGQNDRIFIDILAAATTSCPGSLRGLPCPTPMIPKREGQPYTFQLAFSWFSGQKDGIFLGF